MLIHEGVISGKDRRMGLQTLVLLLFQFGFNIIISGLHARGSDLGLLILGLLQKIKTELKIFFLSLHLISNVLWG